MSGALGTIKTSQASGSHSSLLITVTMASQLQVSILTMQF